MAVCLDAQLEVDPRSVRPVQLLEVDPRSVRPVQLLDTTLNNQVHREFGSMRCNATLETH